MTQNGPTAGPAPASNAGPASDAARLLHGFGAAGRTITHHHEHVSYWSAEHVSGGGRSIRYLTARSAAGLAGKIETAGLAGAPCRDLYLLTQGLEDATCWRSGRLAEPCPDCRDAPGDGKCDDHGRDVSLFAGYAPARRRLLGGDSALAEMTREAAVAAGVGS